MSVIFTVLSLRADKMFLVPDMKLKSENTSCHACSITAFLIGLYRIRYPIRILFGLNSRLNSVFVLGRLVREKVHRIWITLNYCLYASTVTSERARLNPSQ